MDSAEARALPSLHGGIFPRGSGMNSALPFIQGGISKNILQGFTTLPEELDGSTDFQKQTINA
jgi:hypothetical protein